jgi:hypothetical protein
MGAPIGNCNAGKGKTCTPSGGKTPYAEVKPSGKKSFIVTDSAGQARFATTSKKKADNFLKKLKKQVGDKNWLM